MRTHILIVGWLHIVMNLIYVLIGLLLFMGMGTAGLAGSIAAHDAGIGAILGGFGLFFGGLLAIVGLPGTIVGWGIVTMKPWARIAGIVFSILCLVNITTLGVTTIIGIYSLIVLFSAESVKLFESRS